MALIPSARSGFTIVELLIVVVVIAILAAITLVAYNGIRERTTQSSMVSDLSNKSKKLELFYVDNNHYPSTVDDAAWISANIAGASNGATYEYTPSPTLDAYTQTISKDGMLYVNTNTNTAAVNQGASSGTVPEAATASSITATSFSLSWAAISGATSYDVTCARNTALNTAPVSTGTSTSASFARTGMFAGTVYYCGYVPKFGTSSGNQSAVTAAITTPTPTVPTGVSVNTITASSFRVAWTNVTGAYRYNLQCTLSTDTAYSSPVYSHTGTSITSGAGTTISSGLTPSTSYICRVAAKGYNNTSAWSGNVSVTTTAS